jgi:hypothetical protein
MKKFISALGAISAVSMIAPTAAMAGAQVQFPDVQPTNWAYQAIMHLRDRYGCAVGYPDGLFKPSRNASREEMAALVNACLDRITEYVNVQDATMARRLRQEFAPTVARVNTIESALNAKALGVGNYIGAGVLLNRQGIDTEDYSAYRTIAGATIQGRYALRTFSNQNAFSARPFVSFVGTPSGEIGSGGGGMVSYDISLSRVDVSAFTNARVSRANLYAGVGYQVPFVNNTEANFQQSIGEKGQVMFALGIEGRISNSINAFADLKFPTTTASQIEGVGYSPVLTTGLGVKF